MHQTIMCRGRPWVKTCLSAGEAAHWNGFLWQRLRGGSAALTLRWLSERKGRPPKCTIMDVEQEPWKTMRNVSAPLHER